MPGSDLSLLFQIKGENAQAKAALADTQAAVAKLRGSFGNDLNQMRGAAKTALSEIGENVHAFVGERIPLIGGVFVRFTESLQGFHKELSKGGPQTKALAKQIDDIATASGKSRTQVLEFLTSFVALEGQAKRDAAALEFVGAAAAEKLIPKLDEAGASLARASTAAEGAGAAMAGMAGPIGIVVVAMAAEVLVVVELTKEIFELTKASAEYQGKLFDLSQQTGVNVETLSALEVVARKTGGSIDSLTQSLGIFQKNLEEAVEDRGSKAAVAFHKLGVDATDTEAALRQTIAALAAMPEGFQQTALALEVFGRGGKAFLAIAKESKGDVDEILERLKGLGPVTTEQAKVAKEFNDQLVVLEFQLRGLGTQAIPVVLDVLKDLSDFLRDNRVAVSFLQGIVKGLALEISVPLKLALAVFKKGFELAQPALKATAELIERIEAAIEYIVGHPVSLPGFSTAAPEAPKKEEHLLPQQPSFTEQLKDEIQARTQLQGVLQANIEKRKQEASDIIAQAQREFEAGRLTREGLLQATLLANQKRTAAEIEGLEIERAIKLRQEALAKDDIQKRTELSNAILAIDAQIAAKRSEFARSEADLTAKTRLEERKDLLAHEEAQLEIKTKIGATEIAIIEARIRAEKISTEDGLRQIEAIENAALVARGQLLKRQLELAGVGPDRQVVLDKIAALEADRTALERSQSERRKEVTKEEFEVKRDILFASVDTILHLEQSAGQRRLDALKALADARVITEEDAAKQILQIQLDVIDDEIEATKAKLDAAGSIVDKNERLKAEADLNNQLKILIDDRKTIQANGNRDIEAGRQKDLDNERRYASDLKGIEEQIRNIQSDSAKEILGLMQIHFARQKDLIRARARLDIDEENARHQQALDEIRSLREENANSKRTKEEKLEVEKEINRLSEAEAERHRLALKGITDQEKKDKALASPFGGFDVGLQTGQLAQLKEGVKSFGDVGREVFSALGVAVNGLAQGVGQLVQNWVLLGTTGPAAMRKLVASVLAGVAAQAATQAIYELAIGFAALTPWGAAIYGPAIFHFKAAALLASIAAATAIAGRGVAGGAFSQSPGSGTTANSKNNSQPGQLNPLDLERNTGQRELTLKLVLEQYVKSNDSHIVKTVVKDYQSGGDIREVMNNDGVLV